MPGDLLEQMAAFTSGGIQDPFTYEGKGMKMAGKPWSIDDRWPARDRYESDSVFHGLVDQIYSQLCESQFTPTELREALMMACVMFEERHVRPLLFPRGFDGR